MARERTLRVYEPGIALLVKLLEKAYFEATDAREKKLIARLLEKLN